MTPAAHPLGGLRGLVFYRLRPIPRKAGGQRPGQVLARIRQGWESPVWGAEAWKPAGGRWSYEFGGRWLEDGLARLRWQWLEE
jgi:hypothetical protein